MRKLYLSIFSILFFVIGAAAQNQDAIHIGIIPFDVIDNNASTNARLAEDQVSACFVNKDRFYLLDRSVTEKLKSELERAKDNSSAYATVVAEQGKLQGAQYLITGKVGALNIASTTIKNYAGTGYTTTYHGTMHVTLQINSVETGQVLNTYPLSITSSELSSSVTSDILDNVLCKLKSAVSIKIRSLFSSEITIIKVEKEKNGLPQQVLISAGKDIFEGGKNTSCEPALSLTGLFANKKIYLDVISVEIFSPTSKREKKVGELKVESVEGDVTVCKVTKGDKEIKDMLDNKKAMAIRMQ